MKAIISVIGKDTIGILAKVSTVCAENYATVSDVTQSILQDMFVMVMLVDISTSEAPFSALSEELVALGDKMGLKILAMHEDIFNSMHNV